MTAPFRIFCGWDRRQAEAAEVFAYSVRENASIPVEPRALGRLSTTKELTGIQAPIVRTGVTDFSYSRFAVPYLCNYEGRAIYADACDQLCLGDVAELVEFDIQGKPLALVKHPDPKGKDRARSWTSLMLMDCAKLRCWTPEVVETAPDDRLMRLRDFSDGEIGELPAEWNYLMPPDAPLKDPHEVIEDQADLLHWSYLSDPNGGSWIDRSGSALWAEWREKWRAGR